MTRDENIESDIFKDHLDRFTVPAADLLQQREGRGVQCKACAHRCLIAPGRRGICQMRHNREGVLYAPSGYVAGLQVDPIEKKPFYHVLPGANALSFGMLGCNFHCDFCQNWQSSQTLRDTGALVGFHAYTAEEMVKAALQKKTPVLVSTYNEPLITADWAVHIFKEARKNKILCGFVSNGFATLDVLNYLRPHTDIFKVDLKSFSDDNYRNLGGRLKPVLDTIENLLRLNFWIEVVTLVVPGFNDSAEELGQIARFLASLSRDIPWHVTAFYPTYKRPDTSRTSLEHLARAWNLGKSAGLRYVYAGNTAGAAGDQEQTCCPGCNACLIQRQGFHVVRNVLQNGCCPECNTSIPGRWTA